MNILDRIAERQRDNFSLHAQYLNPQMVNVLKTIGFDRHYVRAEGPYLFDDQGDRYLDLLSGFGVFALGRNHPKVVQALQEVLSAELPNLVQMDVSILSGLLAERLQQITPPGLDRIFFANSGTESVEAAIKFSRHATGRSKIVYCAGGYHGLTMGSLSATGDPHFRAGFGPFLPDFIEIPFGDLAALERALSRHDVAAFITEPIQGHGVWIPKADYLPGAAALCRKYGSLFIADEVQTGLGRTGKWWAVDHFGVEPDLLCMAKALSGGFVPVGAVACRSWIFEKVFNRMDRAVVHGSTFGKNNLAMAAGLATLDVLETEGWIDHAAQMGRQIVADLQPLVSQYDCLKAVRGLGMMMALEFGEPKSLTLKVPWKMLETANRGLFSQIITVPLFTRHRILSQVAGYGMNVVKFIPPLTLQDSDRRWIVEAVTDVVADAHRVPGAAWEFGKTLATQAMKTKAGAR
ncbi:MULTISPECIES: aspartate aminotransferase family protein [Cyanophyceae]|uniref:aspartate aminotransferase family protein n=1 Tax=Cyanophyceae TaxID=3028117 RepID=UPI0016865D70|nr:MULTISPECIES: aspartate aminotransferase family protein [Cyanophyceae]MBD1915314.1 aspartate aminotransferase family protein [Phormidium sp. FACHB-77]MBD2032815.1 aspartate aminotransferase family protein [Phormidium sp. FACHB-322]MBD2051834.1 aspartate aminotransferase family protein [Leptolyngbya sp. FACHB-60]